MFRRLFIYLALIISTACATQAQSIPDASSGNPQSPSSREENRSLSLPQEEMRFKAAVKREESEHRNLLEKADEAARIGDEINTAFERNKSLTRDDLKKLERMEKLARKIRSAAGGSNDEDILKELPAGLDASIARLVALSDLIGKSVRKTSRLVVSASVIQNSNELIILIKHIRTFTQP
ncbi:MAG: hypothetical protein WCD76_00175 [Pyrinomonadaceae bacterium]